MTNIDFDVVNDPWSRELKGKKEVVIYFYGERMQTKVVDETKGVRREVGIKDWEVVKNGERRIVFGVFGEWLVTW